MVACTVAVAVGRGVSVGVTVGVGVTTAVTAGAMVTRGVGVAVAVTLGAVHPANSIASIRPAMMMAIRNFDLKTFASFWN